MNNRSVNANQIMVLMIIFVIGASMLANIGKYMGQNIWVVLIGSALIAILLFGVFYRTAKLNNFANLTDIFKQCFGKYIGSLFILIYGVYFFIRSIMVGNSLTGMAQDTLMRGANQSQVIVMLLLTVAVASHYGLKGIGRSAEIFFIIIILGLIPFFSTAFTSGAFKYDNLFPVMAEGMHKIQIDILRTVFFPFGELVLFLMFFNYMPKEETKKIWKRGVIAIVISALLMMAINLICVATLGPNLMKNFEYSFYNAMQLAGVRGLLERMDPIATVIVVLTTYIKVVLYFYASLIAFESLHQKFKFNWVLVFGIIATYFIAPRLKFDRSNFLLDTFPLRILPISEMVIPLLLWGISEYQHRKRMKKGTATE